MLGSPVSERRGESKVVGQVWDLGGEHKIWPHIMCGVSTIESTVELREALASPTYPLIMSRSMCCLLRGGFLA